jgi:putative SOS response-associated peptidase YedK
MCTRFTLHEPDRAMMAVAAALARELAAPPEPPRARWNVAPSQQAPVAALGRRGAEWRPLVWGLVSGHERGQPRRRMLPNAQAETAVTLPAFRLSAAQRRCLIPANGFYEWEAAGKLRLPHLFTLRDEEPFAFAGIWEPADGDTPGTFALLTTKPNALVEPIHHRMPVILTAETMSRWLGCEPLPEAEYRALTQPLPAERMQERRVSRKVGNSRNEGPQCHSPPETTPPDPADVIRGGESDFCLF